jgi:hypothetical protein
MNLDPLFCSYPKDGRARSDFAVLNSV